MFSRGTRTALSQRPRQWEANLLEQLEEEKNQHERELEAASQRAMQIRQDRQRLKTNENDCLPNFSRNQLPKSDVLHHNMLKEQSEGANHIQSNRLVHTKEVHQQNCLASTSDQDLWMQHPLIQLELAEFWAQRAQAREEYRKSKALRETTAMASTATHPARQAPRAAPKLAAAVRARA
jgi:hypothetical protein